MVDTKKSSAMLPIRPICWSAAALIAASVAVPVSLSINVQSAYAAQATSLSQGDTHSPEISHDNVSTEITKDTAPDKDVVETDAPVDGEDNTLPGYTHLDERTPHMHAPFLSGEGTDETINDDAAPKMTETHTVEEIPYPMNTYDRYYRLHLVDEDNKPIANTTVKATIDEPFSFAGKDGTQHDYNKGDVIEFTTGADGYSDKVYVGSAKGSDKYTTDEMPKITFSADGFTFNQTGAFCDAVGGKVGDDPTSVDETIPFVWNWEGKRAPSTSEETAPVDDVYKAIEYTYKLIVNDPTLPRGEKRVVDEEGVIYVGGTDGIVPFALPPKGPNGPFWIKPDDKPGYKIIERLLDDGYIHTYDTIDEQTGELTLHREEKVAGSHTGYFYEEIVYTYKADDSLPYGETRTDDATETIYVGTKATTRTETIPHKTLDEEKPGYHIQRGEDGAKEITTTYTVDAKTGEVTPSETSKVTKDAVDDSYVAIEYTYKADPELEVGKTRTEDSEDTIYVGTKSSTEHVTISHETLEPKSGYKIVEGKDGSKDVVTTYTVNPQTGEITPATHDENVVPAVPDTYEEIVYTYKADDSLPYGETRTDDATETIYVGTKATTRTETIPHKTLDEEKPGYHIQRGEDGAKEITTTYTVDAKTGEVTPSETSKVTKDAVDDTYVAIKDTPNDTHASADKVSNEKNSPASETKTVSQTPSAETTQAQNLPKTGDATAVGANSLFAALAGAIMSMLGIARKKRDE